ncbi:hypothetical protein [Ichthyobacterium seriolicida]|uniref:Uncharacterized protein n=1 Tax=Ichthyobacterium seriolicida TaxID=242600 RepID=A0A1J1DYZ5_9FLAO|nr:hypothetical protein [Ichthyobacterium seriolicida]BAV95146.1 hypothetical protein JBKA6_1133 [Ichthyobacterium seriolicida]
MKTNIFKNLLSLLTLGVVIFSCNKPSEGPKTEDEVIQKAIANIKSIVFKKEKNSATGNTSATPAYAALFVKKTPALPYTDDIYKKIDAVIEGDSVIKVLVPFDKTLNINTATTLTATITLNEKPGENVYLGDKKLTDSTAPFDYPISTTLVHANLIESTGGVSQVLEIKRKDKDGNVLIKKSFKVVFIHDTPSKNCSITKFALKKTATGTNNDGNAKISAAGIADGGLLVLTHEQNTGDGSDNTKHIEYKIVKNTHASSLSENDVLKVDAMILPDGATILTTDASATAANNVDPIKTGITVPATSTNTKSICFKVVAQDGETQKFYKFTYQGS